MNTESAVNSVIRLDDKHIVAESGKINYQVDKRIVDTIYEGNDI